jgi:hypothetical protein
VCEQLLVQSVDGVFEGVGEAEEVSTTRREASGRSKVSSQTRPGAVK